MSSELKNVYLWLLLPVVTGSLILRLLDRAGLLFFDLKSYGSVLAPTLFILAAVFSLGLPMLYRAWFAHRLRDHQQVSRPDFMRFERRLIYIALVTPYLALVALAFKVPGFHFTGIVLMAFYAAYYFYPSKKRVTYEKKIFRMK